jgi:hypothetical protein
MEAVRRSSMPWNELNASVEQGFLFEAGFQESSLQIKPPMMSSPTEKAPVWTWRASTGYGKRKHLHHEASCPGASWSSLLCRLGLKTFD